MNLSEYIKEQAKSSACSKKLVEELKKFSTDEEFIAGVLLDVENEKDKKALLEYIERGIDVDYSQILLNSLWLYQQRYGEDAE